MAWSKVEGGNGIFSSKMKSFSSSDAETWWYLPYDQLNLDLLPTQESIGIILIESEKQAKRRPYHKQKLCYILSNMRHFALETQRKGTPVIYVSTNQQYDEPLLELAQEFGAIHMLRGAERELRLTLASLIEGGAIVEHPHPGWLTPQSWFTETVGSEPPFRMDRFYRRVRKEKGWLMEGDSPVGGKFSHDADNRQPWKGEHQPPVAPLYPVDAIDEEVIAFVNDRFAEHPGEARLEHLPTNAGDHRQALEFLSDILTLFGPYEDAMTKESRGLFHSRLASSVNIHRVLPQEVIDVVLNADVPLNSQEGYLRQMIWREYVHHVHEVTDGFQSLDIHSTAPPNRTAGWPMNIDKDDAKHPNYLNQTRPLPMAYWGQTSGMNCLDWAVESVMDEAWTHHIPRLMVLSNLAQLMDIEPRQLTDWFHAAFIDAFDWVVEPNVLGMGTFALGDAMMTKPYVSGTPYIKKMGDFCTSCKFHPTKTCPISPMYWAYFERHKDEFSGNHRLAMTLRTLQKRSEEKKANDVQAFLNVTNTLSEGKSLHAQKTLFSSK